MCCNFENYLPEETPNGCSNIKSCQHPKFLHQLVGWNGMILGVSDTGTGVRLDDLDKSLPTHHILWFINGCHQLETSHDIYKNPFVCTTSKIPCCNWIGEKNQHTFSSMEISLWKTVQSPDISVCHSDVFNFYKICHFISFCSELLNG